MKELEKVKDEVAKDYGYRHWNDLIFRDGIAPHICNEVAERYATQALQEAAEKIENRYAISLVYRKDEYSRSEIMLRSLTTYAGSKEEALGKAIDFFEEETKGYSLGMKTVIPANDPNFILSLIPKEK